MEGSIYYKRPFQGGGRIIHRGVIYDGELYSECNIVN